MVLIPRLYYPKHGKKAPNIFFGKHKKNMGELLYNGIDSVALIRPAGPQEAARATTLSADNRSAFLTSGLAVFLIRSQPLLWGLSVAHFAGGPHKPSYDTFFKA